MKPTKLITALTLLALALASSSAFAGGPLLIFDPSTQTPYAYAAPVDVYTDLGDMGPLTNAQADALTAAGYGEWTGVATSSLTAVVVGDFSLVPLPDITGANAGTVIGTYNGDGIHVIYDDDGTVISTFFGAPPGVLGIASPDFAVGADLVESWAVVNGTAVDPGDLLPTPGASFGGVFTHEFGHSINLAHTQLNGQILFFGDAIGPAGCPTPYAGLPLFDDQETMYPFIDPSPGSVGIDMATIDKLDDIASVSNVYPAGGWPAGGHTISGIIYENDEVTEATGVNVIARNVADPFGDCISAMSGDYTQGDLGPDGRYTLNGLTPGASYVLYVDAIVAGGFSTPPASPFPGLEEYHNAAEDSDDAIDDVCDFALLGGAAGGSTVADILFNFALLLADDDYIEMDLPFSFPFCGSSYTSVFIGSNGYLTFGGGDFDFSESVSELLIGLPRIAAIWDDLDPSAGGSINAEEVLGDFVVTFTDVPQYFTADANSYTITLRADGTYNVDYPGHFLSDALAGRSRGLGSPDPGETDLSAAAQPIGTGIGTVYELFAAADNDLSGDNLEYDPCEPDGGGGPTPIPLGDDDTEEIPLPFPFPFCGTDYGSVFVNSNGSLSFGGGDFDYTQSVGEFLAGVPRIAPLWVDLSPNQGGIVTYEDLGGSFQVTFDNVTEFFAGNSNNFDVVLYPTGEFTVTYGIMDATDGIAGRTPGSGAADPGESDLSAAAEPITPSTIYEDFVGDEDLAGSALDYDPCSLDPCDGNLPPVALCQNIMAEGDSTVACSRSVDPSEVDAGSFDPEGGMVTLAIEPPGPFTLGANPVILIVTDDCGNADTCEAVITVDCPVPVKLAAFKAERAGGSVEISWKVLEANDHAGFHVWRQEPGMEREQISTDLLKGRDEYTYVDLEAPLGPVSYWLAELSRSGVTSWHGPVTLLDSGKLPALLTLGPAVPNPFGAQTRIAYSLPEAAHVRAAVYDASGRLIRGLADVSEGPGQHVLTWDGLTDEGVAASAGFYFLRVDAGRESKISKVVLAR